MPQKQIYTEIDYYALPEDVRAELIDGQIYYQAAPSRIHQEILGELHATIHINISNQNRGSARFIPLHLPSNYGQIVEPLSSLI